MKLLCVIFSVLVILLSVKPCCADKDCQTGIPTVKSAHHTSPTKDKDCSGCSPFFACGACAGFVLSEPFTPEQMVAPKPLLKHTTVYKLGFVKQISLSIWQPPQLG